MRRNQLTKRISVASGREAADTVIKNGKIIDVFNGEIFFGDIAIVDGNFRFDKIYLCAHWRNSMMRKIHFTVNGAPCSITCHPAKTLLDVLREDLDLTASKECCGKGECGSCSVLVNNEVVCSCLILVGQVENQNVITCEGVGLTPHLDNIQESFIEEGATQCGYCTPGIIVSAKAFLNDVDYVPSVDEIKTALGGNLCRCTGYSKIIQAVKTAAEKNLKELGTV